MGRSEKAPVCYVTGDWDVTIVPRSNYRVMGSVQAPETSMRPGDAPGLPFANRDQAMAGGRRSTSRPPIRAGSKHDQLSGRTSRRHLIAGLCSREIGKNPFFPPG